VPTRWIVFIVLVVLWIGGSVYFARRDVPNSLGWQLGNVWEFSLWFTGGLLVSLVVLICNLVL